MENWKPIEESNGLYLISDLGNVKSTYKDIILKTELNWGSYNRVKLYYNGKYHSKSIHRLVAEAFIPNPENKREVNHKNGVKNDNRANNLEWATASENISHSYKTLNRKTRKGRPIIYYDIEKMVDRVFSSTKDAALFFGTSEMKIYYRCNNTSGKHKNWR